MVEQLLNNPWLVFPRRNPEARLRLFCFPHAGAGAVVFHRWPAKLPPDVEICSIRLPGRESRLREPAFTHVSQIIEVLAAALRPSLSDLPFAFYGHSLGSLIAYELTHHLRREQAPEPFHLFVSGYRAPHRPPHHAPVSQAPDPIFLDRLRGFSGTPDEIFENIELLEFMLPTLRADFSVLETYVYTNGGLLNCPISAFGGREDSEATHEDMAAWRQHTTGAFTLRMFNGGHFFVQSEQNSLLSIISRKLVP